MWIKDIKDIQTVHNVRLSVRLFILPVFPSRLYVNAVPFPPSSLPPSSSATLIVLSFILLSQDARFRFAYFLPFLLSARDVSAARKKIRISKVKSCHRSRDSAFEREAAFGPGSPRYPGRELLRNGVIRIERLCGAPCVSLDVARTYIVRPTLHPRHR